MFESLIERLHQPLERFGDRLADRRPHDREERFGKGLTILANGTVDSDWNPDASGGVNVLLISGEAVFTGGYFSTIGGQPRNNIAALDASTGAATVKAPPTRNIGST